MQQNEEQYKPFEMIVIFFCIFLTSVIAISKILTLQTYEFLLRFSGASISFDQTNIWERALE